MWLFCFSSLALLHIILHIYIFLCDGWKLYFSVLCWNSALRWLTDGWETCAVKTKTAASFFLFFLEKKKKQQQKTNQRLSTCPLIYWPYFFFLFLFQKWAGRAGDDEGWLEQEESWGIWWGVWGWPGKSWAINHELIGKPRPLLSRFAFAFYTLSSDQWGGEGSLETFCVFRVIVCVAGSCAQ